MKKLLFILLLFIAFKSKSQTTAITPKLDDNAIVKDISGNIVPAILWRAYYKTGDYSFKLNKEKTEFIIFEMSDEQKLKETERRKSQLASLPKPRPSTAFNEGDQFKGDKFTDINGIKYDAKTLAGKVLVLNFWFINCPPCRQEMPELNQLVAKYKDNKDVVFLAIALDEKYDVKQFLKTSPFNYNIVPNGNFYSDKYNVSSFPTHVIIGKDGLVKFSTIGLASNTVYWVEKTIVSQISAL